MRYKSGIRFLHAVRPKSYRYYTNVKDDYSSMKNLAQACKIKVDDILKKQTQNVASELTAAIFERLFFLNTYHSLKLCGGLSLNLTETEQLLFKSKTPSDGNFTEQLRAKNHFKILKHCRSYQHKLQMELKNPDDEIQFFSFNNGLHFIISNFELLLGEGVGLRLDTRTGEYDSIANYYFLNHQENLAHIVKSRELLTQTIKNGAEDPFLNAATIHNEFVKGYQFDQEYGLVFCHLYMNFALMLTGYIPTVIDETDKEEYLQLVQTPILNDPKPLAHFLARNLQKTYQLHVLPHLAVEAHSIRND